MCVYGIFPKVINNLFIDMSLGYFNISVNYREGIVQYTLCQEAFIAVLLQIQIDEVPVTLLVVAYRSQNG